MPLELFPETLHGCLVYNFHDRFFHLELGCGAPHAAIPVVSIA